MDIGKKKLALKLRVRDETAKEFIDPIILYTPSSSIGHSGSSMTSSPLEMYTSFWNDQRSDWQTRVTTQNELACKTHQRPHRLVRIDVHTTELPGPDG
jgi:hypothetical protein